MDMMTVLSRNSKLEMTVDIDNILINMNVLKGTPDFLPSPASSPPPRRPPPPGPWASAAAASSRLRLGRSTRRQQRQLVGPGDFHRTTIGIP